jgi:hypothetical protein
VGLLVRLHELTHHRVPAPHGSAPRAGGERLTDPGELSLAQLANYEDITMTRDEWLSVYRAAGRLPIGRMAYPEATRKAWTALQLLLRDAPPGAREVTVRQPVSHFVALLDAAMGGRLKRTRPHEYADVRAYQERVHDLLRRCEDIADPREAHA